MREIKFKFYHCDNGVGTMYEGITGIDYDEQYDVYNAITIDGMWKLNGTPRQYTGLKDKNGTEIYEGDILHYKSLLEQPNGDLLHEVTAFVKVECGMTKVIGKTLSGYIGDEITESKYRVLLLSPLIYEIIGNIYEHPHLLKEG